MITSHIKSTGDIYSRRGKGAVSLREVGKKYPPVKPAKGNIQAGPGDFWALEGVSLDIGAGEVLGIIGRNGAGKTTLLNIIAGVLSPTNGQASLQGKVLGLFNLGAGFQDELTGRENIFLNGAILGAAKEELRNKLNAIIEFSELGNFIDMPLGAYSQGMRLRLGFSIVVNLAFDILAIDEVLAVGDALFQSKCFQRLMDLRRSGKTLVITNQSMDLMERLCDKVALLDHGKLLFHGSPEEGINKYRVLLNTQEFFVGSPKRDINLFSNTKKWADDISCWGTQTGTKEAVIEKVEFFNRFGLACHKINSGGSLKIKVYFRVKNIIKEPHFGVAIFREDGVYCYGPNTKFDGYWIPEISPGRGFFSLDYPKLLLAPGEYRVTIAIWDKDEALPFDYHEGYYRLTVTGGSNKGNQLLNMPLRPSPSRPLNFSKALRWTGPDLSNDKPREANEASGISLKSVSLRDCRGQEKGMFICGEGARLIVAFNRPKRLKRNYFFWAGIYGDDGIYCQGVALAFNRGDFEINFPELLLLPGAYKISCGLWDKDNNKFLIYRSAAYPLQMAFNRQDHGTVYLRHNWAWELPK